MKKLLLLLFVSLLSVSLAGAQTHTQSISFDDGVGPGNAGTYNSTDSFSVDLYLTFNGYNAVGFSLWLETNASAAPFISLTGFTYGTTFVDPTQPFAGPIGFTLGHGNGFYGTANNSDLGATQNPPYDQSMVAPGTYFLGHLTVSLNGLAPGVYVLRSDATNPHPSEVTSYFPGTPNPLRDEFMPNSDYTITVVPEPGTMSLIAVGVIGLATLCRRSKRFHT
jgi:hypothetical protein